MGNKVLDRTVMVWSVPGPNTPHQHHICSSPLLSIDVHHLVGSLDPVWSFTALWSVERAESHFYQLRKVWLGVAEWKIGLNSPHSRMVPTQIGGPCNSGNSWVSSLKIPSTLLPLQTMKNGRTEWSRVVWISLDDTIRGEQSDII